jgi:hypothetical protein
MEKQSPVQTQLTDFCQAIGHGNPLELARMLHSRFGVQGFAAADDSTFWTVHNYLRDKVVPHKVAVFTAGAEMASRMWFIKFMGLANMEQWKQNLLLHDLSKFSDMEALGYAMHDFTSKEFDLNFEVAWNHHKHQNPHHPEHWMAVNRGGGTELLPMPPIYVAEMVADWIGAGKTYGSTLGEWLPKNLHTFAFHPETITSLSYILKKLGFTVWQPGNTSLKIV